MHQEPEEETYDDGFGEEPAEYNGGNMVCLVCNERRWICEESGNAYRNRYWTSIEGNGNRTIYVDFSDDEIEIEDSGGWHCMNGHEPTDRQSSFLWDQQ